MIDQRYAHTALVLATCWLVPVMLLLPRWSFDGYSLLENTTSHLGAQGSPRAWVMNATFLLIGTATLLAGWSVFRRFPLVLFLLGVFSFSLALTGVYRHGPLVQGVEPNAFEDGRHSLFATTTGLGFVALAVSVAFISARRGDQALALAVALAATTLSVAMALWPGLMGLFQRVMFVMAFAWLIYVTRDRYPAMSDTAEDAGL